MIIRFHSIPEQGKDFTIDNSESRTQASLKEFIGDSKFHCDFFVQPMGNSFILRGKIHTQAPLQCAFCGEDMKVEINESFQETMLPQLLNEIAEEQHDKQARRLFNEMLAGQTPEHIDMAEFLREVVGLAIPYQASCNLDKSKDPNLCRPILEQINKESSGNLSFQALKNLKFDS